MTAQGRSPPASPRRPRAAPPHSPSWQLRSGTGSHSPRVHRTDIHRQTSRGSVPKPSSRAAVATLQSPGGGGGGGSCAPDRTNRGWALGTLCVGRAEARFDVAVCFYLIPRWRRRRRRRFLFRRCFRRRGCCGWLERRRPVIRRRRCEVRWRGQMRRRGPIEGLVPVRRRSSVRRRHRRRCIGRVGRRAG